MFIKPFKKSAIAFRDTFRVDLEFELYGQYKNASDVIDAVFNLEQVLVADPSVAAHGYPPREQWITILVETKPIDNDEDVSKFVDILKTIPGVRFAQGIYELPAKPDKINIHLYGGKRSKK